MKGCLYCMKAYWYLFSSINRNFADLNDDFARLSPFLSIEKRSYFVKECKKISYEIKLRAYPKEWLGMIFLYKRVVKG